MPKSYEMRLREWLADRSPRFQYPEQRVMPAARHEAPRPSVLQWKNSMSASKRFFIVTLSLFGLMVLLPLLGLMLMAVWSVLRQLF